MTFLKNRSLLAIIAIGVAVALTGVVFSAQVFAHGQEAFEGSGYVLQVVSAEDEDASGGQDTDVPEPLVRPAAFAADASWRRRFPDTVQFTGVDGEKTSVSQNSFIHYDDASVASFVKTVFVDLDHVADSVIYYYDLPAGRSMDFVGSSWRLSNGASELDFTHLLVKLDSDHYLVLSDDITFSVNGESQMNFQGPGSFLEVEYIEGGVIRFSNNQGSYQTIADDAVVTVGNGVSVNFGDRLVSDADGAKLSLDQMVIDADDNIEISPEAVDALAGGQDEDSTEGEDSQGSAGGGSIAVIGGGASASGGAGGSSSSNSGIIQGGTAQDGSQDGDDAPGSDVDDDVDGDDSGNADVIEDPEDSRKTPTFSLSDGSTSPVGFNANISITDEENMLSSGTTVTIVDRETGKVVYESNIAAGVLDFDISASGLDPDKEYVLSATATYRDGDQEYTKSFLDKVFKTDPIGIMMNKAYATPDSLAVNVRLGDYANVVNAKLRLLDGSGNQVEMKDIDVAAARIDGGVDVVFENLSSNSVYVAELRDVTYSNVTVESFGDALALKTLRRAPTLPVPEAVADRKAMQFHLELPKDKIVDPDAGITGYSWEVYRVADVTSGPHGEPVFAADPVWTAKPAEGAKVALPVDNIKILAGENYVARVLVSFDDNEKAVTYDSAFTTPPFGMDGMAYPTVRLVEDADNPVTFESYRGTLYIDNAAAIVAGTEVKIVYRDDIGNEAGVVVADVTDNSTGTIAIPVEFRNLRSGAMYTVQVYATYDLGDGNGSISGYLGAARFNTPKPDAINAVWRSNSDSANEFSVNLHLEQLDAGRDIDLEMKTMSTIKVSLYEGGQASGVKVGEYTYSGGTNRDNPYGSTLYGELYRDKATNAESWVTITPATFNLEGLVKPGQQYTIVVGPAVDYTLNKNTSNVDVPNDLPLSNATYGITTSKTWPALPKDPTTAVQAEVITNEVAEKFGVPQDPKLDSATVMGYRVRAAFDNGNKIAREVTYNVIDEESGETFATHSEEIGADGQIPSWTLAFGKGEARQVTRGRRYRFTYTMKIQLEDSAAGQDGMLVYPACAKPDDPDYALTSKRYDAPYQLARLSMYLEGSAGSASNEQAVWKWTAHDPDGVLAGDRTGYAKAYFKYSVGAGGASTNLPLILKDGWGAVEPTVSRGKSYKLSVVQNPYEYNKSSDAVSTLLATHYVERVRSWTTDGGNADFTSVSAQLDKNHGVLNVMLNARDDMTREELSAVAAIEVTLKGASKKGTTVLVAPSISSEAPFTLSGSINLASIVELLGENLTVRARVVYDTGRYGMVDGRGNPLKGGDKVAFQQLSKGDMLRGDYMVVQGSYVYGTSPDLSGSGLKLDSVMPSLDAGRAFDAPNGNAIDPSLSPLVSGGQVKAKIASSEGGLALLDASGVPTGTAVAVKHLAQTSGEALEAPNTVDFDSIPPIAHVTSVNPGIDRAEVVFTPELVGMKVKDDAVNVIVEEKKPGEASFSKYETYRFENAFINGKVASVTLPKGVIDNPTLGFNPANEYRFKLSVDAYIPSQGVSSAKEVEVIDKVDGKVKWYDLKLYGQVNVDVTDMLVVPDQSGADPYGVKTLEVRYALDQQLGFTTKLEVFALDSEDKPEGDPVLTGSKDINADKDTFEFNFSPKDSDSVASKFDLGNRYLVRVACYTVDKGEGSSQMLLGEDTMIVRLDELGKPTTSITAHPTFDQVTTDTQREVNELAHSTAEAADVRMAEKAAAALERDTADCDEQKANDALGADALNGPDGSSDESDADAVFCEQASNVAVVEVPVADGSPSHEGQAAATVEKRYGLVFGISVFDLEGSLVDGKYKVRFFSGRKRIETEYDDGVFEISDKNKQFTLSDLNPGTSYTIEVYGVLDPKNTGKLESIEKVDDPGEEHLIATGSGKTTPSSGVEVGVVQLSQHPDQPKQFNMSFYGSLNLTSVSQVKYTIYSPTQVVRNETAPFKLVSAGSAGSTYYVFSPGVDLPEAGMYTIQMSYLGQDGTTLATGMYEYVYSGARKGA